MIGWCYNSHTLQKQYKGERRVFFQKSWYQSLGSTVPGSDGVEYHGGDVVRRAAHLKRKDTSFKMLRLPSSLQASHTYNNTVS